MEGVTVAASRGRSHRNQTDAACCLGRTQGYDGESLRPRHRVRVLLGVPYACGSRGLRYHQTTRGRRVVQAPAAPRVAGWLWPIARYLHAMRPAPMPQVAAYSRAHRVGSALRVAASSGRPAVWVQGVRAARAFSQLRAYRHGRYREVQNFI
uniref:Uncharacterized protein n=1 Tax=Oryza glumipatula TaxID=40148 RepID=A0A0E0AW61_9ORYZ